MVFKKSCQLLGGLILAGTPAAIAHAEDAPAEIVITSRKLEGSIPAILEQQGVRVDTVTADDIAKAGYVDIADSLATTVPGLYLRSKTGPYDYVTVSLQGSRTSDVLWLVDGVRINNRLYAGTTPLDTLPASMVDRIEVLEGGQALFYGTQGVAGAVNVVTKAFTDKPSGGFTVGGDTNRGFHGDGYYSDSIGRSHFVIYANGDTSQGYQPFRSQDVQPSATQRDRGYRVVTTGAKYAYDVTDALRVSATLQDNQAKLDNLRPVKVFEAFNDRSENIITGKIDYTPSDQFQLYAKGYYHAWDSHYTETDNVIGAPGVTKSAENDGYWGYHDAGANLMARTAVGPWANAIAGYDFQAYSGSDAVLVIAPQSESVHAVFGQLATSSALLPDGALALGLRYNAPSEGRSATVWTVSGKYDLTPRLFVRAGGGTAFRLPTAEELFANDPEDERGNPNLKPERSVYANASVGGYLDARQTLRWEVVGFARNITDMIDYATFDDATNQAVFGNVEGQVHLRGGEVILNADYPDWSAAASYTYSRAVQDGNQQIDGIPRQEAKVSVDYHPQDLPFGLTASVDYVGTLYRSGLWDGRESYGNYPVVDLAGRYFLDQGRHQTLTLRIQNLLDRRYATGLGTTQVDGTGANYTYQTLAVPRTAEVRYSYRF
ncbi:vitamin B12 transporter [Nitrospirillum amazonense]|uniref:Vitamin B12 transporter n=1 Tax=Nitrospirillum amazonense TaxID=28077 RepID=A0A560FP66_9PROT|nr:TonB-dependent receptor [Nitrospirillum amazonense]TWB23417.1 vitamin B12 transporter [Nitrospirillum amazonense]